MDALTSYLINEIARAIAEGDIIKAGAWVAFFFIIWLEVRGMKKELKVLNKTVAVGFHEGERRFEKLESKHALFELRLMALEKTTQGGKRGDSRQEAKP